MEFDDLQFPDTTLDKLGRRGISVEQVREVIRNGPGIAPNPRGAAVGSRLLIGVDDGGRILTIVVEPVGKDLWLVRTGWPAARSQIVAYRRRRR